MGRLPTQWPVTLRHGPVTLRPLHKRDERAWSQWFRPWDSTRPPESLDSPMTFRDLATTFSKRARQGTMLPWAVEYHPEPQQRGVFAGQVTVSGITYGSAGWAQIGYWIDPRWAGRGIIPTAVAMACDHCFTTLHLHRIEVAIRPENVRSLRVVEKLGDHEMFALHAEEVPDGMLARLRRPILP